MGKLRANTIAVRRVRGLTIAALVVAAAMMAASAVVDDEGVSAAAAPTAAVVLGLVALVGALMELAFRAVPRHLRPVVFAITFVPVLGAFAALGLPESLIHYSSEGANTYELGDSVSLTAVILAGVAASALAAGHGYRAKGVAAVTVLALASTVTLRDLGVRELVPSWCGADTVGTYGEAGGEGIAYSTTGCTLVLPEKYAEDL